VSLSETAIHENQHFSLSGALSRSTSGTRAGSMSQHKSAYRCSKNQSSTVTFLTFDIFFFDCVYGGHKPT
jgi:hypothetical protein